MSDLPSIKSPPPGMSKGQWALELLSECFVIPTQKVPDEVLREINRCYRHFMDGKPVSGWVDAEYAKPAPLTLGEAFGVPDIRGGSKAALKRKRLAMAGWGLVALFTGQGVTKLPKTKEGYEAAAKKLKLTPSEVEDWVGKYLSKKRTK